MKDHLGTILLINRKYYSAEVIRLLGIPKRKLPVQLQSKHGTFVLE